MTAVLNCAKLSPKKNRISFHLDRLLLLMRIQPEQRNHTILIFHLAECRIKTLNECVALSPAPWLIMKLVLGWHSCAKSPTSQPPTRRTAHLHPWLSGQKKTVPPNN